MSGQEQGLCLESRKGDHDVIRMNMWVYDVLPARHRQLLRDIPHDLCLLCLNVGAVMHFGRSLGALSLGELRFLVEEFIDEIELQETVPPA